MATIAICGFEGGSSLEVANASGTFSIQSGVARLGGYALQINPTTTGTGSCQIVGVAANGAGNSFAVNDVYARTYYRIGTLPASADEEFLVYQDSTPATKLAFRITSAGKVQVYNSAGTLVATGATTLSTNTWYRIDTHCGTSATVGAYEIKINGVSELSGTTNTNANQIFYYIPGKVTNQNSNTVNFYYDDIVCDDSVYPADGHCIALLTAANGTYQTYSIGAGSGSHYQVVQTIPPVGDTSYLLGTLTSGNKETESVQTRSQAGIAVTSVTGVVGYIVIRRNTAATVSSNAVMVRSNTTDSVASNNTGADAYVAVKRLLVTNPATSSAWTAAALDSLEVGDQNGSATARTRMTLATIFVDYLPTVVIVAASQLLTLGCG